VKVDLALFSIKRHVMKTHEGVELQAFLTSTLDELSGQLNAPKKPVIRIGQCLAEAQS
jgi:hypothetical protein